jgi:integrase
MQDNLNYFKKTGDMRFLREVKEGGGEIIKTVSQAVERYAKGKHGYRGAMCIFDKHLKTYKGVKSLNIDVDDFYHHLCRNVSNSSAHTVMTLVRTALKKVDGRVREIHMKPVHRPENIILTKEEVEALFNDEDLSRKYRDVCIVLYYLCLRFSELRHINYMQGMDKIQLFQPKTGKYKTVNIEGKHLLIGALNRLKIVSYTGLTEWLKQKVKDRPYLQRICPDGSVLGENIRSHCFRQSSATHAIQAGADIKMVSKHMLNHSDIAVTLRSYYIPDEKDPFDYLPMD